MKFLFALILILLALAAPVRLAAYWFKAERGTWGRSLAVLFVGSLLVGLLLQFLPAAFTSTRVARFIVALLALTLVSQMLLYIRAWQALVLAVFLTTVYGLGDSQLRTVHVSTQAGE